MPRIYTLSRTKQRRRELRQNSTKAECVLWSQLRDYRFHGYKFRRQHGIGPFIVDFFCRELGLVIEVDGDSHFQLAVLEYDRFRQAWIESLNLRVVRFTNQEVQQDLDGILKRLTKIVGECNRRHAAAH